MLDRKIRNTMYRFLSIALLTVLTGATLRAQHWSFAPRTHPQPPQFEQAADRGWLRTGVDAFILEHLRKANLRPAAEADRATLIRRLSFDLTGLPPSPDDVAAFVSDERPDA